MVGLGRTAQQVRPRARRRAEPVGMVRRQLRSRRRDDEFCGSCSSLAPASDPRNDLLLGPWVHGVDSTRHTHAGEREFGASAAIDYDEVVLRWMDHYLRGTPIGVEKEAPVRYFVMGDNQWHDASAWPPTAKVSSYYLAVFQKDDGSLRSTSPSVR